MAMSLEDLLSEEGFKGRRSKLRATSSFASEGSTMPRYMHHSQHKSGSASGVRKTERTKSDLPRHGLREELLTKSSFKGRRRVDDPSRRKSSGNGLMEVTSENSERVSNSLDDAKRYGYDSSKAYAQNEIVEVEEHEKYKDVYLNEMYSPRRSVAKYSDQSGESERTNRSSGGDIAMHTRYSSESHVARRMISKNRKNIKHHGTSNSRSDQSSQSSKNFDDSRTRKRAEVEPHVSEPALDELAVKAIVSILSGYIQRFLHDEDFRISLHHNCFSLLNFVEFEEILTAESKAIANLEQAVITVEKAAEDFASTKDLKKASLQLSVITGLNSSNLKDGFTCGIANSKLSACAHLYLSVIYKLQKKDRISAKHLLQVYTSAPFEARTTLLPELWESVFLPHLSHLKVWYNQEADSLEDTPSKARKLKLVDKVYNEIMDSGTYQFAAYYKDWLSEGVEAPHIPSITVPSVSVRGVKLRVPEYNQGGLCDQSPNGGSPAGPFTPQPTVSKRLYDSVFSRTQEPGEHFNTGIRSSDGSAIEEKDNSTCSSANVKHMDQDIKHDDIPSSEDGLIAEEAWRLDRTTAPAEGSRFERCGNCHLYIGSAGNSYPIHAMPYSKLFELILKRVAEIVYELQQTEGLLDCTAPTFSSLSEDAECPDCRAKVTNKEDYFCEGAELKHYCKIFDEDLSCSSIPHDFICPLTGLLFEDPVTLETGITFEREAITEWFSKGDRTCPVTAKALECQSVPFSNSILKRVIHSWKSGYCRCLLAFAYEEVGELSCEVKSSRAMFILEQIFSASSNVERIENARHLVNLGILPFLVRIFESGNIQERIHVVALFSCCIEADTSCRNYIVRNIRISSVLELIESKQSQSTADAVLLLGELICINRRKDVDMFLSGVEVERILDSLDALLSYLHSSPNEQRPLVAVLLLYLNLLVEHEKPTEHKYEAVDAITMALDGSIYDEKIRIKCCRALLIMGGRFSSCGKLMTEDWILKEAGFLECLDLSSLENEADDELVDEIISTDEEEERREWTRRLSITLIRDGKKSFLESISKCLCSGSLDLVRACLTTVAWLSSALPSVSDEKFQLSAFSSLISRLKECLENGHPVEHKILASMSLLNFSKIPECRVLLMTIAEEIMAPLKNLAEFTWTAKELYAIVSGDDS